MAEDVQVVIRKFETADRRIDVGYLSLLRVSKTSYTHKRVYAMQL